MHKKVDILFFTEKYFDVRTLILQPFGLSIFKFEFLKHVGSVSYVMAYSCNKASKTFLDRKGTTKFTFNVLVFQFLFRIKEHRLFMRVNEINLNELC